MSVFGTMAAGLARDVAPFGGLTSPLLSWLGSLALLAFFGWHLFRLRAGAARAHAPFLELRPVLHALAAGTDGAELRTAYDRAWGERRPAASVAETPDPVELDRLRELDQAMRRVASFRRPWGQFQKTLLIEHVPWFKEPRVFSTRPADEFFSQDAVVGGLVDLGFYEQVPSLITGFGLLLTFVALCIGLSRLHAEGQDIVGIQGLINGLAGKFLTSIVGLVCANVFVLLERPMVRRLLDRHAEFVGVLDECFPRRTVEDLLDALAQQPTIREPVGRSERMDGDERTSHAVWQQLGSPLEELSAAVRALSARAREPDEAVRTLTAAVRELERGQSRAQAQIAAAVDRLVVIAGALVPAESPRPRAERELRAVVLGTRDDDERAPGARRSSWPRGRRLG
jgi:hypothetical protein